MPVIDIFFCKKTKQQIQKNKNKKPNHQSNDWHIEREPIFIFHIIHFPLPKLFILISIANEQISKAKATAKAKCKISSLQHTSQ